MRRFNILLLFFILLTNIAFAQAIDKQVATIKLIRTEAVTVKQLQKIIEALEKQAGKAYTIAERRKILDMLIDEKILLQAAEKEGITATEAQINAGVQQLKATFESQLNQKISDDQFKALVEKNGEVTFDKLKEQVKNNILAEIYVNQKQKPYFDKIKTPTDKEIKDYYDENRANFISPEWVRFKQIVILTKGLGEAVVTKYKAKIDKIYQDLGKGASWDDYWNIYMDDSVDKIGGLNQDTWRRDDSSKKVTYGKDFFDVLFKLKENSVSEVIKSEVGYHIIMVLEKIPFKTLALDDKIPPKNTAIVKDQIKAALITKQENDLSQQAVNDLLVEIKKTATIKIFDQNLAW